MWRCSQALTEAEDWTTNKSLIDTGKKGLHRAIPYGFPYFHVSWKGGGYAHIVEDEDKFSRSFGMDVAKGMLDLPPDRFGRRDTKMTFEKERQQVPTLASGCRARRCASLLCCAGLCNVALRCAVLCRAVLCCAVLCCAVLCCAVLCCAVLCCAVLCCAVLCCAALCCAVLSRMGIM
jgi:hypothetical protein